MRSITILITDETAEALAELARRDYRAPRQQAALLLQRAVERTRKVSADQPALKAERR